MKFLHLPMNLTDAYCQNHTTTPGLVLNQLERQTYLRTLSPQMLSGPYQGRLLTMLSQMIQPEKILEIGTFTGYSAICLAQGLAPGGLLHTIEVNDELASIALDFFEQANLSDKIRLHIGDAKDVIPTLSAEVFDLVWIDAGKLDYLLHYNMALPLIRPGGWLLADNVLWDGKVPKPEISDETTQALRNFNDMIHKDPRVENLILPVRDGMLVARKC